MDEQQGCTSIFVFALLIGIGAALPTRLAVDVSVGKIIDELKHVEDQSLRESLYYELEQLGQRSSMLLASWIILGILVCFFFAWLNNRLR
jgi:hypothetical protein